MTDFPNKAGDLIERIMQTAKAALPDSLADDIKDNVRTAIQEVISDLDVVSREELNIQKEVLAKTRTKVDEMESVIAKLEQQIAKKN